MKNQFGMGCCCGGTGGTGIPVGGCCFGSNGTTPATIYLTPNAGSSPAFPGATLAYGPKPPDFAHATSGIPCDPGWWSPRIGATNGRGDFYYNLCACELTVFYNADFLTFGVYGTDWSTAGGNSYTSFPPANPGRCAPFLFVGTSQQIQTGEFGSFTMSG